jgi:hypothetical protein
MGALFDNAIFETEYPHQFFVRGLGGYGVGRSSRVGGVHWQTDNRGKISGEFESRCLAFSLFQLSLWCPLRKS